MTEPAQASVATGNADLSFREIVETHKRALYYLALDLTGNHHDAEDLSQEVFIKAPRITQLPWRRPDVHLAPAHRDQYLSQQEAKKSAHVDAVFRR